MDVKGIELTNREYRDLVDYLTESKVQEVSRDGVVEFLCNREALGCLYCGELLTIEEGELGCDNCGEDVGDLNRELGFLHINRGRISFSSCKVLQLCKDMANDEAENVRELFHDPRDLGSETAMLDPDKTTIDALKSALAWVEERVIY